MAGATLVEQRLFCYTLAKHISQHNYTANARQNAEKLFSWCQGSPEPDVAFKALASTDDTRTGRVTLDQMLTAASEAYSFAMDRSVRTTPDIPGPTVRATARKTESQSGRSSPGKKTKRVGPNKKKQ